MSALRVPISKHQNYFWHAVNEKDDFLNPSPSCHLTSTCNERKGFVVQFTPQSKLNLHVGGIVDHQTADHM